MMKSIIFIFLALLLLVACEPDENPVTPTPNEELRIDSLGSYRILKGGIIQIHLNKILSNDSLQIFLGLEKLKIVKNESNNNKSSISTLSTDTSASNYIRLLYNEKELQSAKKIEFVNQSQLDFRINEDIYFSCDTFQIKGSNLSCLDGFLTAKINSKDSQIASISNTAITITNQFHETGVVSLFFKDSLIYTSQIQSRIWNEQELLPTYQEGSLLKLNITSFYDQNGIAKGNANNIEVFFDNQKAIVTKIEKTLVAGETNYFLECKVPNFVIGYVKIMYNGCEIGSSVNAVENEKTKMLVSAFSLNVAFTNKFTEIRPNTSKTSGIGGFVSNSYKSEFSGNFKYTNNGTSWTIQRSEFDRSGTRNYSVSTTSDILNISFNKNSKHIAGNIIGEVTSSGYEQGGGPVIDKPENFNAGKRYIIKFENIKLASEDSLYYYYEITDVNELKKIEYNYYYKSDKSSGEIIIETTKFIPQKGDYFKLKLKKR